MSRRPLRDKDKYYPGSPWGEHPPQEIEPRLSSLPPGVTLTTTTINGLRGQIVDVSAPAGNVILLPQDAGKHIDAYFEYRQLVGDSDGGRLLPESEYEALRARAADPSRRVWAHWVESSSGLECKSMGPSSMCFCGHRYREHAWDAFPETGALKCKMRGCSCADFSYVPVRGTGDVKCSACKQSYLDHDPRTKRCKKGRATFASSYSCSCNSTYDMHKTVVQTNAMREAAGKLTNAPWMGAAVAQGLPTAHMGGIGSFTSLADGIDRALAGAEPGFEPQRVYDALARDTHSINGVRTLEANARGISTPTNTSRPGSSTGSDVQASGRCPRMPMSRDRYGGPLPIAGGAAMARGSGNRSSSLPRSGSGQQPVRRNSPVASQTRLSGCARQRSVGQESSSREFAPRVGTVGAAGDVQDPLSAFSTPKLAALAEERGLDLTGCSDRNDVLELLRNSPF